MKSSYKSLHVIHVSKKAFIENSVYYQEKYRHLILYIRYSQLQ